MWQSSHVKSSGGHLWRGKAAAAVASAQRWGRSGLSNEFFGRFEPESRAFRNGVGRDGGSAQPFQREEDYQIPQSLFVKTPQIQ